MNDVGLIVDEVWKKNVVILKDRLVTEMKMLRGMSEYIIKDRISNDHISERVGVTSISEKMRDYRLRWYEHVQRRELDVIVRIME